MIKKGTRYPQRLARNGVDLQMLARGARPIWLKPEVARAIKKSWLDENVKMTAKTTLESDAMWFDLEIILPDDFTGSPETGWTNGTLDLGLDYTTNLDAWETIDWITTPGTSVEDLMDGTKRHFARASVPVFWIETMVDLRISSNRQGKSITAIHLLETTLALANYPYEMPADAAQLQTDLRALGLDDSTVSVTTAPLTVQVKNHTSGGTPVMSVTMDGADVTAVGFFGDSPLDLPGYPYTMPTDRADLQADLRANGAEGAVVKLFDDVWEIFIPDQLATGNLRPITLDFTPNDPYPAFDFTGASIGEGNDSVAVGTFENVRDPEGDPLREEIRAFAVMRITNPSLLP